MRMGFIAAFTATAVWAGTSVFGASFVERDLGSGTSTASLVIEFTSHDAVQFNYAFTPVDGDVFTGFELLGAVRDATAGTETALTFASTNYGEWGDFINKITYGSWTNGPAFVEPDGFWHYWTKNSAAAVWNESDEGASFRAVSDGTYDGWTFSGTAPVPEPGAVAMLMIGGVAWLGRRRRAVAPAAARGAARHHDSSRRSAFAAGIAVVCVGVSASVSQAAVTFNDIQYWVGTGSNRAGFVVDWNDGKTAESLAWGFRWDGAATGETMLKAIVAADPRLFAHVGTSGSFGVPLYGMGYDLDDDGIFGTTAAVSFDSGGLAISNTTYDASTPTDSADHWQEGWNSAGYWSYWISPAVTSPTWGFSGTGMSGRTLVNGMWDGWSYAPGFSGSAPSNPVAVPEPACLALLGLGGFSLLRRRRTVAVVAMAGGVLQAVMVSPTLAAYQYNPNDFATEVVSYTGPVDGRAAYSDPTAVLGRPALRFNDSFNPNTPDIRRSKIIEPPYNYSPGDVATRKPVITVLPTEYDDEFNPIATAALTVKMGRAVADDPANPYGTDLIVFGNGFFIGGGGFASDATNLNTYTVGGIFTHGVQVSVSADNVNWFSFPLTEGLMPYNAYRWDRAAAAWTDEELDPTRPLNPSVYTTDFSGSSAADVLDAYGSSSGGTGFDLANARDGLGRSLADLGIASIEYVRLESPGGFDYAVISGIAAVPEPAGLAAVAALGLLARRRR